MIPSATPVIPEGYDDSVTSAAPGAAEDSQEGRIDFDLQELIKQWPDLPDAIKAAMLAMVRTISE